MEFLMVEFAVVGACLRSMFKLATRSYYISSSEVQEPQIRMIETELEFRFAPAPDSGSQPIVASNRPLVTR